MTEFTSGAYTARAGVDYHHQGQDTQEGNYGVSRLQLVTTLTAHWLCFLPVVNEEA